MPRNPERGPDSPDVLNPPKGDLEALLEELKDLNFRIGSLIRANHKPFGYLVSEERPEAMELAYQLDDVAARLTFVLLYKALSSLAPAVQEQMPALHHGMGKHMATAMRDSMILDDNFKQLQELLFAFGKELFPSDFASSKR